MGINSTETTQKEMNPHRERKRDTMKGYKTKGQKVLGIGIRENTVKGM